MPRRPTLNPAASRRQRQQVRREEAPDHREQRLQSERDRIQLRRIAAREQRQVERRNIIQHPPVVETVRNQPVPPNEGTATEISRRRMHDRLPQS